MKILTVDNSVYELDTVPDEVEDLRYCVFDTSDPDYKDYYFLPLIFLESFHAPAICLQIGDHKLQMPMDWSIVTSDEDFGSVEVISLASLNNRGFKTPVFNPMRNGIPDNLEIQITNVYQDVKWYFPKMKNGQLLSMPLTDGDRPDCVFVAKDITRQSEVIEYASLI